MGKASKGLVVICVACGARNVVDAKTGEIQGYAPGGGEPVEEPPGPDPAPEPDTSGAEEEDGPEVDESDFLGGW